MERQAGERAPISIPGIWKEDAAECQPTWSKDECRGPRLGVSHMTTDHGNISICPCSQLLQLRHMVLKHGIVSPSAERIVLLCLRDGITKHNQPIICSLFPSDACLQQPPQTHPGLLATICQHSTYFNFRNITLKRSTTKQQAIKLFK